MSGESGSAEWGHWTYSAYPRRAEHELPEKKLRELNRIFAELEAERRSSRPSSSDTSR
jgi:hypothetical protein